MQYYVQCSTIHLESELQKKFTEEKQLVVQDLFNFSSEKPFRLDSLFKEENIVQQYNTTVQHIYKKIFLDQTDIASLGTYIFFSTLTLLTQSIRNPTSKNRSRPLSLSLLTFSLSKKLCLTPTSLFKVCNADCMLFYVHLLIIRYIFVYIMIFSHKRVSIMFRIITKSCLTCKEKKVYIISF